MFFFQAEDGIRDIGVTGVQTCALPILNQGEIAIGLLARECLGRRRIADLPSLRSETRAWTRRANRQRRTVQWQFTRRKARKVFGYRCPGHTMSQSGCTRRHQPKPISARSEDYLLEGDLVEADGPLGPGAFLTHAAGAVHGPHRSRVRAKVLTVQRWRSQDRGFDLHPADDEGP